MHLQENTLFDVTWNVARCPLHHVTYVTTEFEVTTSEGLGGDAFTRKFIITLNVAQYLLHNVTYSAKKFEIATSNGLGEDAFTRKYII